MRGEDIVKDVKHRIKWWDILSGWRKSEEGYGMEPHNTEIHRTSKKR